MPSGRECSRRGPGLAHSSRRGTGLSLLGLLPWILGCTLDDDGLSRLAPPSGAAAYEAALQDQGGVWLSAEEVARIGWSGYCEQQRELASLARRIDAQRGWREVFLDLQKQGPRSRDEVLEAYREVVERAVAFVRQRDLVTLPPHRLDIETTPEELPRENYPLAAYLGNRLVVTTDLGSLPWGSKHELRNHCRVCIPPLVVHEGVPGHHVTWGRSRGQRYPSEEIRQEVLSHFKNRFFYEGWAQYAEVLMLEQGFYEGAREELGARRMLLLRAARAWLDPLLHTGRLEPRQAARFLEEGLFLSPSAARAEVRRHLAEPGMKASYWLGMLQLLTLRKQMRATVPALDLRQFHDRVVEWPLPIPRLAQLRFGIELEELDVPPEPVPIQNDDPSQWVCTSG